MESQTWLQMKTPGSMGSVPCNLKLNIHCNRQSGKGHVCTSQKLMTVVSCFNTF